MQQTVKDRITFAGVGLHSGKTVTAVVKPAIENQGIIFIRKDITDKNGAIPGAVAHSMPSPLCTTLVNESDVKVHTVEHLLSALRGLGVDNAIISLDGPEVPFMDGSAIEFVKGIQEVGLEEQEERRQYIRVLKEVRFEEDDKFCRLYPSKTNDYSFEIDFPQAKAIGKQKFEFELTQENYISEIAENRSFGIFKELDALRAQGLIKGGSLENAVVVDGDKVLNPEGLRNPDEFVRHKMLDAIGDLYLAGTQIIGGFEGYKCSHAMHSSVLKALFSDPDNFEITVDGML